MPFGFMVLKGRERPAAFVFISLPTTEAVGY
jgi:hypothetical protein